MLPGGIAGIRSALFASPGLNSQWSSPTARGSSATAPPWYLPGSALTQWQRHRLPGRQSKRKSLLARHGTSLSPRELEMFLPKTGACRIDPSIGLVRVPRSLSSLTEELPRCCPESSRANQVSSRIRKIGQTIEAFRERPQRAELPRDARALVVEGCGASKIALVAHCLG